MKIAVSRLGAGTGKTHVTLCHPQVTEKSDASPLLLYAWTETWQALDALRTHQGGPFDGIAMDYRHPQTGGPAMPTMRCRIQLLRPGEHTQAHRHTGSTVCHVVKGAGISIIDGQRFDWQQGDRDMHRLFQEWTRLLKVNSSRISTLR